MHNGAIWLWSCPQQLSIHVILFSSTNSIVISVVASDKHASLTVQRFVKTFYDVSKESSFLPAVAMEASVRWPQLRPRSKPCKTFSSFSN